LILTETEELNLYSLTMVLSGILFVKSSKMLYNTIRMGNIREVRHFPLRS